LTRKAETTAAEGRQMAGFKDFYQWTSPTRVIAGRGLIASTGFEFTKEGAARILVVTDGVIRKTGLVERVEAGVVDGGLEVAGVFDEVPQDSDTEVVASCSRAAKDASADSFLAVGGGSVMDTAKAANVLFTHGGTVREWEGFLGLPRESDGMGRPLPLAPLAAIPTTAGTGSEASFVAVVKDRAESLKVEVADLPMFPALAILDPAATETLPPQIAAATGMDALTHAIEGFVSSEWNQHTDAFALHAIRLIRDNLPRAVEDPSDAEARGNMLIAANIAIAPTGSGAIGITHSMSHPCGGRYGVPHGVANTVNLPWVIEYNAAGGEDIADRYRAIAELIGADASGDAAQVGKALADHVRGLTARLGLPRRLSEVGVPEAGIPALVEGAMGDGCTLVNPREPTEEDFVELYRRAL
jgi:alcohol dehydrogenase class IV